MKRTRLRPVSATRLEENELRARLMKDEFGEREDWWCQFNRVRIATWPRHQMRASACGGEVHGHELLKRSRGGSITDMANVLLLCDLHNSWVENHPELANKMGLAHHSWDAP